MALSNSPRPSSYSPKDLSRITIVKLLSNPVATIKVRSSVDYEILNSVLTKCSPFMLVEIDLSGISVKSSGTGTIDSYSLQEKDNRNMQPSKK